MVIGLDQSERGAAFQGWGHKVDGPVNLGTTIAKMIMGRS
jgi:hypothetical protein